MADLGRLLSVNRPLTFGSFGELRDDWRSANEDAQSTVRRR